MSDVVVVGSISIDNVIQVEHLPERDEVAMGKGYTHLGGRGANQAVAASRMGASVALVACVGSDHRAEMAIEALVNDHIDIQAVYRERSTPTGIAQISVDAFGNRVIAVAPEANNYLLPERIRECEELIAKAKVVLVQCEIPLAAIHETIHIAKQHGVTVILNNSPVAEFAEDVLASVDYIVVNEMGLNKMAGKTAHHVESIESTARALADTTFLIIRSHRQMLHITRGETKAYQAPLVEAVDRTGSTGVFCGVLGALLARGVALEETLQTATAAMALSTTRFGAQPSAPYPKEVEAFLQRAGKEQAAPAKQHIADLKAKAREMRIEIIRMLDQSRSGHPGGSLSATDIITTLFFNKMRHRPGDPAWPDRDRFVMSKGHACPALYSGLALAGYFDKAELGKFRKFGAMLQGHPDRKHIPGVEVSTGSLGQGLSMANGMALAGKLRHKDYRVFCLLSDGELEEGQVWEAAMTAGHRRLDNLCAIVDFNGIQLSSTIPEVKSTVEPIGDKFKACGWHVRECDGYDIADLIAAFEDAERIKGRPTVIVASTLKGRGVSYMERNVNYHGKVPPHEECEQAIREIQASGETA